PVELDLERIIDSHDIFSTVKIERYTQLMEEHGFPPGLVSKVGEILRRERGLMKIDRETGGIVADKELTDFITAFERTYGLRLTFTRSYDHELLHLLIRRTPFVKSFRDAIAGLSFDDRMDFLTAFDEVFDICGGENILAYMSDPVRRDAFYEEIGVKYLSAVKEGDFADDLFRHEHVYSQRVIRLLNDVLGNMRVGHASLLDLARQKEIDIKKFAGTHMPGINSNPVYRHNTAHGSTFRRLKMYLPGQGEVTLKAILALPFKILLQIERFARQAAQSIPCVKRSRFLSEGAVLAIVFFLGYAIITTLPSVLNLWFGGGLSVLQAVFTIGPWPVLTVYLLFIWEEYRLIKPDNRVFGGKIENELKRAWATRKSIDPGIIMACVKITLCLCLATLAIQCGYGAVINRLYPNLGQSYNFGKVISGHTWVSLFLQGTVTGPFCEEIIYRFLLFGWLLHGLFRVSMLEESGRYSFIVAGTISSAIFAFDHEYVDPTGFMTRFVAGLVYCYMFWATGGIFAPVFCHGLTNAILLFSLYAYVAAIAAPYSFTFIAVTVSSFALMVCAYHMLGPVFRRPNIGSPGADLRDDAETQTRDEALRSLPQTAEIPQGLVRRLERLGGDELEKQSRRHPANLLRDMSVDVEGRARFSKECFISAALRGKKIVLAFDRSMPVKPVELVCNVMDGLKDDPALGKLLINMRKVFFTPENAASALAMYAGKSDYEVFMFASMPDPFDGQNAANAMGAVAQNTNVHGVYINDKDFKMNAYYPLLEIVAITLAQFLEIASLDTIAEEIDLAKLNIRPNIAIVNGWVTFSLIPDADQFDKQELIRYYANLRRLVIAA
ncbi:MAG: type II CAAX endopeptidase family protein, partial [Candidatus Omnitrophota bacterium]